MNAIWEPWPFLDQIWTWIAAKDWWKLALAVVATITALCGAIKAVLELWDRFTKRRLTVEWTLQDVRHGNLITIVNIGEKPLPVSHFDVVWYKRRWWGGRTTYEPTETRIGDGFTIPAHERHKITYADADWFSWNADMQDRYGRLWFRVWVAGDKRVKWFKLH